MKQTLINSFILLTLLAGCSENKLYVADPSLHRAWTVELEKNVQLASLPYALSYDNGHKEIIYILTDNNPDHFEKLDQLVEMVQSLKPDVILKGDNHGSGDVVLVNALIKKGYTIEDIFYSFTIEQLNQSERFRIHDNPTLFRASEKIMAQIKAHQPLYQRVSSDYRSLERWFKQKMHLPLTKRQIHDGILVAPIEGTHATYLQKVSKHTDDIQEVMFLEKLAHYLNKSDIRLIYSLRPASQFVTEKPILDKMMGVQPTLLQEAIK